MDEKDTEAAPMQVSMLEDPQHGAWSAYQSLGEGSAPVSNDSLYSKLFCIMGGIGKPAGDVMVGEETKFCCIHSQLFCGFQSGDSCPAANGGCYMFKPELVCEGSAKIFCIKLGFELPKTPYIVCCQKEVWRG